MTLFMSLGMAFFMSMGMSFMMTSVNFGIFSDGFFFFWGRGWCIGFIVALPLAYLIPKLLRAIAAKTGLSQS